MNGGAMRSTRQAPSSVAPTLATWVRSPAARYTSHLPSSSDLPITVNGNGGALGGGGGAGFGGGGGGGVQSWRPNSVGSPEPKRSPPSPMSVSRGIRRPMTG